MLPYFADAVEWWMKQNNTWGRVHTKQEADGSYKLVAFDVPGLTEPTEPEIQTIITNYQAAKAGENTARRNRKAALLTKLGITTAQEKKALRELLEDFGDDAK